MEVSPLPHKAPFIMTTELQTPSEQQEDDSTNLSPDVMQDSPLEAFKQRPVQE